MDSINLNCRELTQLPDSLTLLSCENNQLTRVSYKLLESLTILL